MIRTRTHVLYGHRAGAGRPAWVFDAEKDQMLRLHWSYGTNRNELYKMLGVSRAQMFRRARKLGLYIEPRKRKLPKHMGV